MEEDYDETALTQRVYAEESETLEKWIQRLWYQEGPLTPAPSGVCISGN